MTETDHTSTLAMKKESYRKAPQCERCVFYRPEGPRPGSIDPDIIWKASCGYAGCSFQEDLEPADICFDAVSVTQWKGIVVEKNKNKEAESEVSYRYGKWYDAIAANNDAWRKSHPCASCAFFGRTGAASYLNKDDKPDPGWFSERRCRGYVHAPEREKSPEACCDYISARQWTEICLTPKKAGRRRALLARFLEENRKNIKD